MVLDLQVYTRASDGFGSGSYSSVYDSQRSAILTLQRDIFSGDNLNIESKRSDMDAQLQKIRPVRLYADSAKIFDGCILAPDYRFKGNNKNNFSAVAVSWDKELAGITISAADNASYSSQTIDYIFADLCRIANNYGITKKAIYAYDTSKLPYYDAGIFGTLLGVDNPLDFTGQTVWSAMQKLTQFLDIYEITQIGEWAVKVDALQDDFYIYMIPQMLNINICDFGTYEVGAGFTDLYTHPYGLQLWAKTLTTIDSSDMHLTVTYKDQDDLSPNTATVTIPKDTVAGVYFPIMLESDDTLVKDVSNITGSGGASGNAVMISGKGTKYYRNFQLAANKTLVPDYSRLLNYCEVQGYGGLEAQILGNIPLLDTTSITSNDFYVNPTIQPTKRNYLRVAISNPAGSEDTGSVKFRGFSGLPEGPDELLEERFFLTVPAGETKLHVTDNRYYSLSMNTSPNTGLNITGFSGCTVKVEEFMYGVAGRSINAYGLKGKLLPKNDITEQVDVDAYANQQVLMYHAPLVKSTFELLPAHQDYTDLIGKTVRIYDELAGADTDFFCIHQEYRFAGKGVHESLALQRYNFDWEYSD